MELQFINKHNTMVLTESFKSVKGLGIYSSKIIAVKDFSKKLDRIENEIEYLEKNTLVVEVRKFHFFRIRIYSSKKVSDLFCPQIKSSAFHFVDRRGILV